MQRGWIRIIGGQWRGRRLQVPAARGVRPTPDRVRETLFNWLAPFISGAYCLDLYAGTGVLGFEALSRGAAYVELVDQSPEVVSALEAVIKQLDIKNAAAYRAMVPLQLPVVKRPFDIVFLDPPYQADLLLPCAFYLEAHGYLAQSAYLYLEAERAIKDNELPRNWQIIKSKQAGQVAYHLAKRTAPSNEAYHD